MDQQLVAVLTEHTTMMFGAVVGALAICAAYWFAVAPAKRAAWLPPVIILLAVTTTLVISVIKTSVALSLGLIGAMSVARFRTQVSDPRQLALVLVAIAVGMGFGAGELLLTGIGTLFIAGMIVIFYRSDSREPSGVAPTKVTARLSFASNSHANIDFISDYLQRRHVVHRIKGTARKADVTSITVHFFYCTLATADQIVQELAYVLANCQFESELQVKSATGDEVSDLRGNETDAAPRRVARRRPKTLLQPTAQSPAAAWGQDLEQQRKRDVVEVRTVKGLLVDKSKRSA